MKNILVVDDKKIDGENKASSLQSVSSQYLPQPTLSVEYHYNYTSDGSLLSKSFSSQCKLNSSMLSLYSARTMKLEPREKNNTKLVSQLARNTTILTTIQGDGSLTLTSISVLQPLFC